MRARARTVTGPVVLLVLYVGFFWRLTLTSQFTWLEGPDTAYQVVPWIELQAQAFHHGQLPLWDPYEWGGQSLIGQMQPGTSYPLNWILFALPLKNGFVRIACLHWYFVLLHYLGGLFCYFLCRDRRLGIFASVVGGLAFGVSGWMGSTDWPQMLNGAIWAPLIFLFLLRALPAGAPVRYAGLAGTFLGVAFLSGHHQIPIFLALSAGAALIYLWTIHARLKRSFEAVRKTVLLVMTAVLISGLATVPALAYARSALRWVGAPAAIGWRTPVPYSIHEQFSLHPAALLDIAIPHPWSETRIFLGWSILALAVLGVLAAWRDRAARVFACLALGGLIFALGGNSLYQGLAYRLIPLIEKARSPDMATFLFDFAVSVLAAYGTDEIWNRRIRYERLQGVYRGLYCASAALAILATAKIDPDPFALGAFSALLVAIVCQMLRFSRLQPKPAAVLLALVALFELSGVTGNRFPYRNQPDSPFSRLSRDAEVAAFVRSRPGAPRMELNRDIVPYNFGDWYGIDVFEGYTASMPENVARIAGDYGARMLLSLRYTIGAKPAHQGETEVFAGQDGVRVYENSDAFPRAWAVHKTVDRMTSSLTELRSSVVLYAPAPALDACASPDGVAFTATGLNSVSIDARMACKGMVIASEVYAPGWRAYVDGRRVKIWPAYSFLRGVVVPAGKHRIDMIYRPASVILGAAMSLLGLAISLWMAAGSGAHSASQKSARLIFSTARAET